MSEERPSLADFSQSKREGRPLTVLTAYDAPTARVLERCGVSMVLVGDSVANAVLGRRDTVAATMQELLHHCRAVRLGAPQSFVVGDMPFLSYQVSSEEAVRNAGRFLQEAGCDAVKLEGGREPFATVRRIIEAGIPVMGHLGLTPQSATLLGGLKVQARTCESAERLLEDARGLQDAGCFALVLECVPREVAGVVTRALDIPTIGIGAGPSCDGQVLVVHDLLGWGEHRRPRFVRTYADLDAVIEDAVTRFRADVEAREYPADSESFHLSEREHDAWQRRTEETR